MKRDLVFLDHMQTIQDIKSHFVGSLTESWISGAHTESSISL